MDVLEELTPADKNVVIAYAECGMNALGAGRRLHFSNNGINYHLTKVRTLTGLNPREFYDLIKLVELINNERREYDRQQ